MPRALDDNRSWIGWVFFADLASALSLTLGYMFAKPFVMDSSASEERLGLVATPLAVGLARTVAWWQAQQEEAA